DRNRTGAAPPRRGRGPSAETHLARCAGCREAVAELRALAAGAAALPKSIEPGRDLWAPIPARSGRPATWNAHRAFLAAAATLVIGFTLYRLLPSSTVLSHPDTWAASQLDYARATDELAAALTAERDRLRPPTGG